MGSTYLIIQRIFQLKSILSDMANPDLTMSDARWEQVENFKEILFYPFLVRKKLQCSNLTTGPFLKECIFLIFCIT